MMNREQWLLMKLAEEASEIAQISLKTAQFGPQEKKPGTVDSNLTRIKKEMTDLLAVMARLNIEFGYNYPILSHPGYEAKWHKLEYYYQYSISVGQVEFPSIGRPCIHCGGNTKVETPRPAHEICEVCHGTGFVQPHVPAKVGRSEEESE